MLHPSPRTVVAGIVLAATAVLTPTAARAAGPRATMTPDHNLTDGQHVTIRASGFDPDTPIQVLACSGTLADPPKDARACEGTTLDSHGYTDARGNYLNAPSDPSGDTAGYRVAVLPSEALKTVSIRCGPQDPCVLYVGPYFNDFTAPHTFLPLVYKGAPAAAGGSHAPTPALLAVPVLLVGVAGAFAVVRRRRRRPGSRPEPVAA
jgi:hypothetical protein